MTYLTEEPFFFASEGANLFGFLHNPERASDSRKCGVILCHPFAEEKAVSHRILTDFARTLSRNGYQVMRFDFRGCGDSEGEFSDSSLSTQLSDISRAIDVLQKHTRVDRICLFGLRLGGTLAALAAARDQRVKAILLWEPVLAIQSYLNQFIRLQVVANNATQGFPFSTRQALRQEMRQKGYVDILGYGLGEKYYTEFSNVDLISAINKFRGSALVVTINKRGRDKGEYRVLVNSFKEKGIDVRYLAIADTPFWNDPNDPFREVSFWQGHENLFEQTISWLNKLENQD